MMRSVEWGDDVVTGKQCESGYLFVSRNTRNFVLDAHHYGGGVVRPVSEPGGGGEGGLYEQAPRVAAPFLSVDFPRFGWRRH